MDNTDVTFSETGPDLVYRQALEAGRFQIQHCKHCARHVFYPRVLCNHCGAAALEWVVASGRAIVYSTTVVRRKPDAGGDINIVLVDLEEGVRMMSRVEGLAPEQVHIGMVVKARIIVDASQPLVVFVAEQEAA
jgi:uncharacterized OB-fold protein